jgi:hypothetical protein
LPSGGIQQEVCKEGLLWARAQTDGSKVKSFYAARGETQDFHNEHCDALVGIGLYNFLRVEKYPLIAFLEMRPSSG